MSGTVTKPEVPKVRCRSWATESVPVVTHISPSHWQLLANTSMRFVKTRKQTTETKVTGVMSTTINRNLLPDPHSCHQFNFPKIPTSVGTYLVEE